MDRPGLFVRVRARLHRDQEGFALIETVAAMGIVFVALMVLAMAMLVGLTDSALARQRQIATGIADKLFEQVRALNYNTVAQGLSDSDLSGDTNIVNCSGTYRYKTCSGEVIVHFNGTPPAPLYPHRGSFGSSDGYNNTYSYSLYVTQASGVPAAGAMRVTAQVSWSASARATASSFSAQTLIYQGLGTGNPSTRTSSSTNTFFQGVASASAGKVVVTPGTGVTNGVSGLGSWDSVTVTAPALDADVSSEDLTSVNAQTTLTATKNSVGGVETISGGTKVASAADNDPTSSTPSLDQPSNPSQSPPTASVTGGGNSITAAAVGTTPACPITSSNRIIWQSGLETGNPLAELPNTGSTGYPTTVTATSTAGQVRNGNYALKVAPSAGTAFGLWNQYNAAGSANSVYGTVVAHFAIKLVSLPTTSPAELFSLTDVSYTNPSTVALRYNSGQFQLYVGGQTLAYTGVTVTTGTWYVIDIRGTTNATTYSADLTVNGGTSINKTATGQTAKSTTFIRFGTNTTATYTAVYDDMMLSGTSADYPLPDGQVKQLAPSATLTPYPSSGVIQDDAGAAIGATSHTKLTELPATFSTGFAKMIFLSSTASMGVDMSDTTDACIGGVTAVTSQRVLNMCTQKNCTPNANFKVSVFNGATETVVGSFTTSNTNGTGWWQPLTPTAYPWAASELNGLTMRFGYMTTSQNGYATWDFADLEYSVPLNSGVQTPGNESGSTVSSTAAVSTHLCGAPSYQNDSKPCAYATNSYNVSPAAAEKITADLSGSTAGTCNLYTFTPSAAAGATSYAYGRKRATSGDGTVKEEVYRYYGSHTFGGLCSSMSAPANWAGYFVKFDAGNSAACAVAEAGVSVPASPSNCSPGTITMWNGTNYTTETVSSSGDWSYVPASQSVTSGSYTMTFTPSLSSVPSYTSQTPTNAAGTADRTSALSVYGSPVVGTIRVQLTNGATTLMDVTLAIDLGTLTASTKYTPAT